MLNLASPLRYHEDGMYAKIQDTQNMLQTCGPTMGKRDATGVVYGQTDGAASDAFPAREVVRRNKATEPAPSIYDSGLRHDTIHSAAFLSRRKTEEAFFFMYVRMYARTPFLFVTCSKQEVSKRIVPEEGRTR